MSSLQKDLGTPHPVPPGSVVVAVDTSAASGRALAWASARAARGRSPLHILAVPDSSQDPSADGLLRSAREQVADIRPDVLVTHEVSSRDPVAWLVAASGVACVVVLGHHEHGHDEHGHDEHGHDEDGHDRQSASGAVVTSSVATDLVASARCPVVVVKDVDDPLRPRVGVVVGVDGSRASAAAVAFAFAEAESLGTCVDVVHAREGARDQGPLAMLRDLGRPHYQLEQRGRLWLSESLAGVVERHPGVEVTRIVAAGDPVRVLLDRSDGAHLLVVGSHDRGSLSWLVLGSVSREVLRRAGAPVAVVRPTPS